VPPPRDPTVKPSPTNEPAAPAPRPNHAARHRRRGLPYLAALVLMALILFGLWPQPVPVETARAATGPLRATINEEGRTRVRERFIVSAPVTGQLRRIVLKPGAPVEAGQTVVAVIDPLLPTPLDERSRLLAEARRDAAAAALEKARAAQAFAASELRRFETLYAAKTVSIQELEGAQWREAAAARDQAAAQSALRQAEAELAEFATGRLTGAGCGGSTGEPSQVRAPTSGRVLRVFEESSRVVSAGTALLELGDPTNLEVAIEVLSRDAAVLRPGTRVQLEHWGGPAPLEASVRWAEPAAFTKVSALGVEEQRVLVIADLTTPPERRPGLGDHYRVEARIIVWETERTLKVPSGALFRQGQQWATFVVTNGRAQLRPLEVGRSSGTETQVLQGLHEGDTLILYPGDRVGDGQRVRTIKI